MLPPEVGQICLPSYQRKDERGLFVEIVNEGPWESVIHGTMKCGAEMGNHYHRECRAFFYVVQGSVKVSVRHLIDNTLSEIVLKDREGMYFRPFETHVIRYLEDSTFLLLKSYRYREECPDIYPSAV